MCSSDLYIIGLSDSDKLAALKKEEAVCEPSPLGIERRGKAGKYVANSNQVEVHTPKRPCETSFPSL